MKIYLYPIIIFLSLNTGCRKEDATFNKFQLLNSSGVTIKILPTTSLRDTLTLLNNESKGFDLSFNRGLGTGDNFAFFADGNPVTVIFNDSDTIVHYNDNLTHMKRYYKQTSNRNFYNTASYQKEIVDDTKHLRTVTLKYFILNRDYLDAK